MIQKWISCSIALWACLATAQGATALSSATSGKIVIDTRVHKTVMTFGRYWPTQSVSYSGYAWDTRFASETAEVTVDGVALVKSASEGQVSWRPARVGLHTLHHTVHGGTLTRTYYAEGPTVRIVCTQTGTAGSMLCQIDCDMPGATIYYTTDGTEPTTASRVYTGPFQATLPKVKRLLAVAVVDGYPMSQTAYPIISIIEDVSVVSSATSGKMVVDTRAGKGPIATDHAEDITYSNLWSGDANATATVAVNGEVVKTEAGEGVYRWPLPNKGGNYVLTHKTTKSGAQVGETLTATFVVASHEIEIDDGTGGSGGKESRFSSSGVYDGKGHGITVKVTSVANPKIAYSLAKTGPYVGNLLLTNACDATAIWYTVAASGYNTYTNWATVTITPRPVTVKSGNISKVYDGTPLKLTANGITADNLVAGELFAYRDLAERTAVGKTRATFKVLAGANTQLGNYDLTTKYGTLTVTKAAIGGGGGEPGDGVIPDGGLSKFDATFVYDGAGHTIDTNALSAVKVGSATMEITYSLDGTTDWVSEPPVYTNAGQYVIWYRLRNPNYNDYVHEAQLTITPKPISDPSITKTLTPDAFMYDGTDKMPKETIVDESVFRKASLVTLQKGVDYTVTYEDNVNPGTATAIVSGIGNYGGTTTLAFTIVSLEIEVDDGAARQRYPWNGMVDVEFTIAVTGESGVKYDTSFLAKDLVGGTSLPMKTVHKSDGSSVVLTNALAAGTYKWVWNTAADLPKGFSCERVKVEINVVRKDSSSFTTTGTSPEFKIDLRGLGPWQRRTADATESLTYSSAWATNSGTGAKSVVKVMPILKQKPKYVVIDLNGGTNAMHYPVSYLDAVPKGGWSDEYKTSKLVLRHIPAGSFIMGRRATDCPGARNRDLHMVTITRDFYLGVFSITQRQWELVMGNRPSSFTNETCYATRPVENVSYQDIRGKDKGVKWPQTMDVDDGSFMDVLRRKVGMNGFDLPTEAQWEYACRAGTTTALNDGRNLSDMTNAVELATTARYAYNSGWSKDIYQGLADGYQWTDFACGTEKGPDKVGNYAPNAFGLYDMHGNIYDLCLDVYGILKGSIDPCGWEPGHVEPPLKQEARTSRGGSWRHPAYSCSSGGREGVWVHSRMYSLGFRLCLQGGDVPDLAAAATLVDKAGTGEAAWSPTRAGTYYLTHATMNAETNAQLLSAWFEVPGPMLTFTPQGELTNGVTVAIGGAEGGWTIRYTMDGSAPAADSPVYEGPFSLPASCTVRSVAYNEQGMASEEFSQTFTLHDALGIVGAVARQRYPWNGKVDVDVELKGDPAKMYLVELTAKDLDGGTNLSVKTVSCAGASTTCCVPPGRHRFTWDADADIQTDGEFPRVAVSVSATGSALVGYARQMALTVDGYTGAETLTNVPVLVRLSTAIEGFCYGDFADASGGDLIFTDESGSTVYPHEIDEWHTNGESLVWVKLPLMANGTKFKAGYGGGRGATALPDGDGRAASPLAAAVWSDYAGVWHMNEDSGTAYDSTANGLDGIPSCGTNALADVRQMVAYENGACGRARVNGMLNGKGGNYLHVPASRRFSLGGNFCAEGWFRVENQIQLASENDYDDPRLVSLKPVHYDQETGFEMQFENGADHFYVKARAKSGGRVICPTALKTWVKLLAEFSGTNLNLYANGVFLTNRVIKAVCDDDANTMGFGGSASGIWSLNGQYDEIRLRGGTLSADWIKADYDMIKNRDFLIYGPVKNGMGAAE